MDNAALLADLAAQLRARSIDPGTPWVFLARCTAPAGTHTPGVRYAVESARAPFTVATKGCHS